VFIFEHPTELHLVVGAKISIFEHPTKIFEHPTELHLVVGCKNFYFLAPDKSTRQSGAAAES